MQRFLNLNSFKPHLMRKRIFSMAFFGLLLLSPACALADGAPTIRWDFDTLDGWVYEHQDQAPVPQCSLNDGNLYIYTRAYTRDRQKMHTAQQVFTCGRYSWRTYISPIATGEQTSIGSWIYCDEQHELDFEVGPGTADVRRKHGIGEGELAACMTSQANPFASSYAAVRTTHCSTGWSLPAPPAQQTASATQMQAGRNLLPCITCRVSGWHIPERAIYMLSIKRK